MIEQLKNGYQVIIRSADELGGFPITGKRDAAIIEVYDCLNLVGEKQIVEDLEMASWVSVDWNGLAESLNNNRGMFTFGGYGVEIQW